MSAGNAIEYIGNTQMPCPLASAMMDGCMESGRDMMVGGAQYNSTGSAIMGIGTVVDSLCAIKYLVFDEKICSAQELYDAVMNNWEGYDSLRMQAMNKAPRYGNGNEEADKIASWVSKLYTSKANAYIGPRGGYRAGAYSAGGNLSMGWDTYATPNGRKSGEVVSDAASPTHGADCDGPLAVIQSVISLSPKEYGNGCQFCIRLHPTCVKANDNSALEGLIKGFFATGGMQLQINVMDSDTLRRAQAEPDKYRNIVVRVAGFSAYFVELCRELQDDIIQRTDNVL